MKALFILLLCLLSIACVQKKKKEKEPVKKENIEVVVFNVNGMTCSSCEKKIESAFAELDEIIEASANHLDSTTTIRFDANKIDVEELAKLIESNGYDVAGHGTEGE